MRSDASRNHETILRTAIAVLADSPQAGMREIAGACGAGRTTLYRHFPNRDALVAAIYHRVLDEAGQIISGYLDDANDAHPVELLADLSVELAGLGDRYRFLEHHTPPKTTARTTDARPEAEERLYQYILSAQHKRQIRDDLDPDWLLTIIIAIITQAAGRHFPYETARTNTVSTTVRSLLAQTSAPRPKQRRRV